MRCRKSACCEPVPAWPFADGDSRRIPIRRQTDHGGFADLHLFPQLVGCHESGAVIMIQYKVSDAFLPFGQGRHTLSNGGNQVRFHPIAPKAIVKPSEAQAKLSFLHIRACPRGYRKKKGRSPAALMTEQTRQLGMQPGAVDRNDIGQGQIVNNKHHIAQGQNPAITTEILTPAISKSMGRWKTYIISQ